MRPGDLSRGLFVTRSTRTLETRRADGHPDASMFARFLVGMMLLLAPIAPGFWLISLAERSEEHDDVVQVEELSGRIARGRLVQAPPPTRVTPLTTSPPPARRRRRRTAVACAGRFGQRRRHRRRLARCVLYDDPDPDPDSQPI